MINFVNDVWNFCKDLFLNLRTIWYVNQIVLFNGIFSDFVDIPLCVYTKQLFFSIPVNIGLGNIYLAVFAAR